MEIARNEFLLKIYNRIKIYQYLFNENQYQLMYHLIRTNEIIIAFDVKWYKYIDKLKVTVNKKLKQKLQLYIRIALVYKSLVV